MLDRAPDINSWAAAGPGCAKGVSQIVSNTFDAIPYTNRQGQRAALAVMRELLDLSREPKYWPKKWPQWEMREVEHWLCEYAKMVTGMQGKRLKRRFTP